MQQASREAPSRSQDPAPLREQVLATAVGGFDQADQHVEPVARKALELLAGLGFVDHAPLLHHVLRTPGHPRLRRQAVAPGAARLLVVALDRARQVERRPDSLTDAVRTLLREVFEPMELHWAALPAAPQEVVSLKGQGTVLLVNLPHADREGASGRSLVLRHAQHGQRLFTTRDVRLAQYIVRQLEQASRLDAALEQGRSEERLRIAQDLHDDIGARLLTLMYQAPNPDIEDYIRHTIQDLKTLTRGLAASSHALSDAASEWKRDLSHRIDAAGCQLSWHASWDEDVLLSMVQGSALTRILRELVSNALGHAQASHIQVQLQLNDNTMVLRVSDNGRGRAPDTWSHGLGLGGIRKRVKQLGGSVKWSENVPCGIVCEVHVHPFMAATVDTDSLPPIGSD